MFDQTLEKLKILAEYAKYDVSCSSSGSNRSAQPGGLGNGQYCGICHSFTSDGRCISLLKTLMSNDCCYNCSYCGCKSTAKVERASFSPEEVCEITINFYKRNYIEGLFLSSAVEKSPTYTMQKLTDTVILLREKYKFNGYIHLKGMPSAPQDMIMQAARYVDRMSFNIELPSEQSLKLLAPQKSKSAIIEPMRELATVYKNQLEEKKKKIIIPAGQTTQMIVGASPESDGHIIRLTQGLYDKYRLKRVYYSSYLPVNTDDSRLPAAPAKKIREHRLYQADWLLRFYGFTAEELLNPDENLSDDFDPKVMWALKNYNLFPVEINTAPIEVLLKVPGIGNISAYKIAKARKHSKLNFDDLKRMKIVMKRAVHFITCAGKFFGIDNNTENIKLKLLSSEGNVQLSIFEPNISALTGQI